MASPQQGWRGQAACTGVDVRVFYPDAGKRADAALRICSGCVVRVACLQHALDTRERWGVWGGKTEDERRAILRASRKVS